MKLSRFATARTQNQVGLLLLLMVLGLPASVIAGLWLADGTVPAGGREQPWLTLAGAALIAAWLCAGLSLLILQRFFGRLGRLTQEAERAKMAPAADAAFTRIAERGELAVLAAALQEIRAQQQSFRQLAEAERARLASEISGCQSTWQRHAEQLRGILIEQARPDVPAPRSFIAEATGAPRTLLELGESTDEALTYLHATTEQLVRFRELGEKGQAASASSLKQLAALRAQAESRATLIQELVSRARTIAEITDAVKLLTSQIDHVALNATIEAARAGEVGRGFAIVASEVRTLADQSKSATQRMRQVLTEIQQLTSDPLVLAATGEDIMDSTVDATRQLDGVVHHIRSGVPESIERCNHLLAVMTRQAQQLKDIQESVAQLQQKEERLHGLTAQSEELKQLLAASERDLAAAFAPNRSAERSQSSQT